MQHDGRLVTAQGKSSQFDPQGRHFLYLNARTGWPDLTGEHDGCVIVARNSMSSGDTFDAALKWAKSIQPRAVIVVDDLGDRDTITRVKVALGQSIVLPVVSPLTAELTYQLGRGSGGSTLTANPLADRCESTVAVHAVAAPPNVEQAFAEATDAMIGARRIFALAIFSVTVATEWVVGLHAEDA